MLVSSSKRGDDILTVLVSYYCFVVHYFVVGVLLLCFVVCGSHRLYGFPSEESALELLAFSNTQKKQQTTNKTQKGKSVGPSRRSLPKSQTKSLSSTPE